MKTVTLTDEEIDYILSELEFGGPVNDKERALEESIVAKLGGLTSGLRGEGNIDVNRR